MRTLITAIATTLALSLPAQACEVDARAPTTPGQFDDLEHFTSFLGASLLCVRGADLLAASFPPAFLKPAQLQFAQNQFDQLFPRPMTHAGVVKSEQLGSGFLREMRAYWRADALGGMYVYMFVQETDEGLRVLNVQVKDTPEAILALMR